MSAVQRIGKYDVLTQLAKSAMSEVFLGCAKGPGGFRKYVVIKRVLTAVAQDDEAVRMFLDEARVTAGFSHPNIAQLFDLGEDAHGLYLAMEFIPGQDLAHVAHRCAVKEEVLPYGFTCAVAYEAALALHYAHGFTKPSGERVSVVHRDIAPKNLMVSYEGQVKLLDFGIAKAQGALSKTAVGQTKGTAGYMSPEQVRGQPLDGRSDVFSLGVVLWELCTGRRLFAAGSELEELKSILTKPVESPRSVEPTVPEELADVVMKALEREPNRRFASAKELAKQLERDVGDLFFDADLRGQFVQGLFAEQQRTTQQLFELADREDPRALDTALEAFKRQSKAAAEALVDVTPLPKPKRVGRAKPKQRLPSASDERLAEVQQQLEQVAAPTAASDSPSFSPLLLVTVLLGALLLVGLGLFFVSEEDDATTPALGPEAAVPAVLMQPPKLPSSAPPDAGSAGPRRPPGEVTLALFPEATVYRGMAKLGSGTLVNLTLPAGTHRLTVVGTDGVQRWLSVPVESGKKTLLKLQVADLPKQ